jgi:nicotinate-nucleotide adenylyltransferase
MAELRLGVLGGTFNPIHLGHLVLAESFRERLALDRVLFVPAGAPPHKSGAEVVAPLHRYAMVNLALAGHPAFLASHTELERPGPSYSVDTLEILAREWTGARLFFLMGSDTFLELPTWRTPDRLRTWATLAVGHRAGSAFAPEGGPARAVLARLGYRAWEHVPPAPPETLAPDDIALVAVQSLPVSAREIRQSLAAGTSVRYRVPLAVVDYIAQHRLYDG